MRMIDFYINLRVNGWEIEAIADMMGVSHYMASKYETRYQLLVN